MDSGQDEKKIKSAKSLDKQILAVLATIFAGVLVIVTLQGTKERLLRPVEGKNYAFLDKMPRVTGLIFAATSAFYLYDTACQCRESPGQKELKLLLAANFFALFAAAVKLELVYKRKANETAQQEADQSTELE